MPDKRGVLPRWLFACADWCPTVRAATGTSSVRLTLLLRANWGPGFQSRFASDRRCCRAKLSHLQRLPDEQQPRTALAGLDIAAAWRATCHPPGTDLLNDCTVHAISVICIWLGDRSTARIDNGIQEASSFVKFHAKSLRQSCKRAS